MNFLTKILTIIIFSYVSLLSAQQSIVNIKQFTTEDGLANLNTRVVYKSKHDFLWMSTKYGLNRYDGYSFQLYTKENNGLQDNSLVSYIAEGEKEALWIFYYNGKPNTVNKIFAADVFDTKTKKAVSFQAYFKNKLPFSIKDIATVRVDDPKQRPFIVTRNGRLFLLKDGQFTKVFDAKGKTISTVTIDKNDNIYIGIEHQILMIDFNGNIKKRHTLSQKINQIWIDEANQIWVESFYIQDSLEYSLEYISLQKIVTKSKKTYHTFSRDVYHNGDELKTGFYYIGNGNWMVTERNKVYIKNFKTDFTYNLSSYLPSANYLSKFAIYKDKNIVWVAQPTGLYKIDYKLNPFKYIYYGEKTVDARGITEDENGNIYFNCENIFQFSPQTNQLQVLSIKGYSYAIEHYKSTLFSSDHSQSLLGSSLNLTTQSKTIFQSEKPYRKAVFCLLKTARTDEFLAGTEKGLFYLNLKTGSVKRFDGYNGFDILKKSLINSFQRKGNQIWIATDNGIFLMSEKEGILQHFSTTSGDLPFNHINHFSIDKDNTFWLASRGFGLIKWQPFRNKKSTYRTYTINEGLSHNYLYAVYQDDYDRLWITSDKGLMIFNKATEQVRTFTTFDGLKHNVHQIHQMITTYQGDVIIEDFLPSEDITTAYYANPQGQPQLLTTYYKVDSKPGVTSIMGHKERFMKWGGEKYMPKVKEKHILEQVEKIVPKICKVLNIRDVTRVDGRLDKNGQLRIFDVNGFPALVFPESVQVKQAIVCFPHHDKMKVYEALLNTIVMTAAQRYNMSIINIY